MRTPDNVDFGHGVAGDLPVSVRGLVSARVHAAPSVGAVHGNGFADVQNLVGAASRTDLRLR